jgi:8-oxo-dGTP diphosphatase
VATTDSHGRQRVVAGLLVRDESVLLCRRSRYRQWYPGVWDLPGGHMEEGETVTATLCRELFEELGIVVHVPFTGPWKCITKRDFAMDVAVVASWSGTASNQATDEHEEVVWFHPDGARQLQLADEIYPALIEWALRSVHAGE